MLWWKMRNVSMECLPLPACEFETRKKWKKNFRLPATSTSKPFVHSVDSFFFCFSVFFHWRIFTTDAGVLMMDRNMGLHSPSLSREARIETKTAKMGKIEEGKKANERTRQREKIEGKPYLTMIFIVNWMCVVFNGFECMRFRWLGCLSLLKLKVQCCRYFGCRRQWRWWRL